MGLKDSVGKIPLRIKNRALDLNRRASRKVLE